MMEQASACVPWPSPAPLEGVKSRKRKVFAVDSASVAVGEGVSRISGLKLSLESRIVAVGCAGRAAVELLLGERQLLRGTVNRHESLNAVHLGPCLVARDTSKEEADVEVVMAAVAGVLREQPQVVVLEEGRNQREIWDQAFNRILRGPEVRAFKGAVVVFVEDLQDAERTELFNELCPERWAGGDGWLWQEYVAGDSLEICEDVLGAGCTGRDASMDKLLREVSELSALCFNEDSVAKSQDRDWILSVLTDADEEDGRRLCGFICHKPPSEPKRELHIARLAVPKAQRSGGHGQRLMCWILRKAARMSRSQCAWISLSSLDSAMEFYERFGFMDMTCDDHEDPDHFQTWMEMQNHSVVGDAN